MRSSPICVAVISPQPVVAEGLKAMLARHHPRVDAVGPNGADVVLYDVLGLVKGDEAELRRLVAHPGSTVLALSRDLRPDLLSQALAKGVDGYLSIGVSERELLAGVESATTGWRPGDPGPDPTVGSRHSRAAADLLGADVGLAEREVQILGLIAQGLRNDQIAAELYLSINTVKSYVRSTYHKIGVTSRSEAVLWAIGHGFAPPTARAKPPRMPQRVPQPKAVPLVGQGG